MRRVLLLTPHIGSGYLTKGKVYDVERIDFYIYNQELEESEEFNYDTITDEQKERGESYIYIIDDRGQEEELIAYISNITTTSFSYLLKLNLSLQYYQLNNVLSPYHYQIRCIFQPHTLATIVYIYIK